MTLDEFCEKVARIERLERILFLLVEVNRPAIFSLRSNLDEQDRQIITEFYDENRGRGW